MIVCMGNYNVRQMNRLVSTQIESDSSLPAISRLDQNIQKKEQELLAAKKIFPKKLKALTCHTAVEYNKTRTHKYKHKEHKGTEHIVAA
jgi:hypothetical protein